MKFAECRVIGEEQIRSEDEMDEIRRLRNELAELTPPEAAALSPRAPGLAPVGQRAQEGSRLSSIGSESRSGWT